MKALFISNDPSIFDPASAARTRMQAYAAAIGTLYVLSRANVKDVSTYRDGVQEGGLILYAVGGGKLMRLLALMQKAHALVKREGIDVVSAQDPFEYGWVAARAVRGTAAKLHLQVHTDFCSPWFTRASVMRSAHVPMPLLNKIRLRIADAVLPRAQ